MVNLSIYNMVRWKEMKEVLIDFDNKSPADLNKNINIAAFLTENDDVEYKFMEGIEGIWKPIQDFSKSNILYMETY